MARPRKTFGPLVHGTLIVAFFGGMLRLWLWYTDEPEMPRVDLEATVAAFVTRVTTSDREGRVEAIRALGETLPGFAPIGEASGPYAQAVAALRGALRDSDASVRAASARILGILGPSAGPATDELTAAMKDDDHDVGAAAACALLKIGGDVQAPALRVLAGMVADPEPIPDRGALVAAMHSAGEPGQDAAARALVSLLANKDGAVRSDAAQCVSALGAGAARIRPALEVLLKADDPALRYTGALAAMQARDVESNPDPRIVTILVAAVSDTSLSLTQRQDALAPLLCLFQPAILQDMGKVTVAFPAGSSALRRCGLELARQLEHKDADVRLAAATLLHMIDPQSLAGKDEATGIAQP